MGCLWLAAVSTGCGTSSEPPPSKPAPPLRPASRIASTSPASRPLLPATLPATSPTTPPAPVSQGESLPSISMIPANAPVQMPTTMPETPKLVATMETNLEPLRATAAIKDTCAEQLRFTRANFDFDPRTEQPPGDLFTSGFVIHTYGGETIEIRATWVDENRTLVTIKSDLPEPQHERVAAAARKALDKPDDVMPR
jgi:hypothetical protein